MPLLHRQVAHGDNHAENLIQLKHDCSSFVSSTLDTRDSYMVNQERHITYQVQAWSSNHRRCNTYQ
jgi:hypothetical protein